MERTKLALLAVIAACLVVQGVRDGMPEARADTGEMRCEAWYQQIIAVTRGEDKALEKGRAYAEEIKAWMIANPGDPVFRTTLVHGAGQAYVDIMCVR